MTLRFTPRALAEAKRIKTWWRRNRAAAPDLFEQELAAALDRIAQAPGLGRLYERPGRGGGRAAIEVLQWAQDSAFRYFPLIEDSLFGLTLHPVDHATNKLLALTGRRAVRDWVDAITCHERIQPLGYLAWAASGKDPGLTRPPHEA